MGEEDWGVSGVGRGRAGEGWGWPGDDEGMPRVARESRRRPRWVGKIGGFQGWPGEGQGGPGMAGSP